MDYSNLGQAVKILPRGVIDKGSFGTDSISNFQSIIGATNQTNTVDASTADAGASLNLNLANNSLQVNLSGGSPLQFEVVNFVNAIGSKNNDTIIGGNQNSKLTGGGGSDSITGGNKNDQLAGTDRNTRDTSEVDTLTGGGGRDKFILGDRAGAYYLGGSNNDYALITDFNIFQDSIDIGSLRNYSFAAEGTNTLNLFAGRDINTRDLIAKIQIADFGLAAASKGSQFDAQAMSMASILDGGGASNGIESIAGKIDILSGASSTADATV
jgi:Ca2+-binding RTX toxin-like protein